MKRFLPWMMVLGLLPLGACEVAPPSDAGKLRILSELENRVAVAKIGTQVCRQFAVGVSEHNWVRGRVTALDGSDVTVTVEDPGRIPLEVQGVLLEKGVRLKDAPANWTPCL